MIETAKNSDSYPLCVDLDGTLIRSDLLLESFLRVLHKKPWLIVMVPVWLLRGKAVLKKKLASLGECRAALLPYDPRVLELLEENAHRRRVLCTASDESLARSVAEYLGVFDETIASNGDTNLAGEAKANALVERFGNRKFDYVGNSSADLKVWKHAHSAWVVNGSRTLSSKAAQLTDVVADWPSESGGMKAWIKAIRVHQWLKNLLVFVPLLASHKFLDAHATVSSALAFVAFSLCASGVYVLNDLLDLESDRLHPRKRLRPFASGALPILAGMMVVPMFTLAGFAIAWQESSTFFSVLLGYWLLTLAYSLGLKRISVLDVVVLAALYTIRIFGGAVAISAGMSFWLFTFSMFVFFSLAMLKRATELGMAKDAGKNSVGGRAYLVADLPLIQGLGMSGGLISVLVLCLYINAPESRVYYSHPQWLWFLCPLMLYWICRIWLLAHRGSMHDDPVVFAVTDKISLVVLMLCVLSVLIAI